MQLSHGTHSKLDDRGVVALELVLVAPFLFLFILIIAQFGIYFSKNVDVNSAARDAARTLALRGTPNYAGLTASGVVTCVAGDTSSDASVTLTTSYTFDIPFISLGTKSITATGTMRCGG